MRSSATSLRLLIAAAAVVTMLLPTRAASPRFFADDPIQADNDRAFDAGKAVAIEGSNGYDFLEQTFFKPGDHRRTPAVNVNTIGEVPDSSWFTNRISRGMSLADIVRGPNTLDAMNIDGWPIVQEKTSGITPGYRVVDPDGRLYQLKFDPPENPEMSSGAEVIGAAIYHALGYNVVQGYIVDVDPAKVVVAPTATTVDLNGRRRTMVREDVNRILARAAKLSNGKYRAMVSRFADGKPLGYFKYYGTRPDDPNDIHPHEHRRELRASRVFAAWLNHDDSRGLNSLDMLESQDGRAAIRHYMFDFGSIMGSGSTRAQAPRAGNEYILEWGPSLKTLLSFGAWIRPWLTVDYWEGAKSVGRFEADFFDPVAWKPEYPNPAFNNMDGTDAFWAARLVSMFTDDALRAVVAKARFSEPGAAEHITKTLITRRDKVLRAWLSQVNPLADARLDASGMLTFENVAVRQAMASPPTSYLVSWRAFDNTLGRAADAVTTMDVAAARATAPASLLASNEFVSASVQTIHPMFPEWKTPVTFTFRKGAEGWTLVGLDR